MIINNITGHRVHWPKWASWKAVEDTFDRNFWNDYIAYHKGTNDAVCKKVKEHQEMSYKWFNKYVLNYPIQGGGAILLKQAAADLFEWIVKHDCFGKILFCVFVHDELDCECPKEYANDFSKIMENIMSNAAKMYYRRLPIPAESSIGSHWIH